MTDRQKAAYASWQDAQDKFAATVRNDPTHALRKRLQTALRVLSDLCESIYEDGAPDDAIRAAENLLATEKLLEHYERR